MPTAMVTFNGRITLPSHVRKELGLKTGDSVDFVEIEKGRFAIAPGAGTIPGSRTDPKGWIPQLDFSSTADEMDESLP
jgi:AbrB family looped-hinge helix DNA binding protein